MIKSSGLCWLQFLSFRPREVGPDLLCLLTLSALRHGAQTLCKRGVPKSPTNFRTDARDHTAISRRSSNVWLAVPGEWRHVTRSAGTPAGARWATRLGRLNGPCVPLRRPNAAHQLG